MDRATPPSAAPITNCMKMIHHRFVLKRSTTGLQRGFMTHGKYNQLVYNAMSVLEMPSLLNMITATVMATT